MHPNSHKKLIEMADLSEWCDAYRTVNNYGVDKSNWSEVSLYAFDHNHPHVASVTSSVLSVLCRTGHELHAHLCA